MTEQTAVISIKKFAENRGYTVEEFHNANTFFYSSQSTFAIVWDGEFVTHFMIRNYSFAPPDEVKWFEHLYEVVVHQPAGDLSWLNKFKSFHSLRLDVWKEFLPESLKLLPAFQELYLTYPRMGTIRIIPPVVQKFTNLQCLSITCSHYFIELPDWLHKLPNLQKLFLSNCKLKSIPYSVVQTGLNFFLEPQMKSRPGVHLSGAQLEEGDLSLFDQQRGVIEQHYSGKQSTAKECKVIFLGDGAAGKSSLIDRIIHNKFEEGSLPTDGVKISIWDTIVDGESIHLRILDFGGQEIMHAMHRCFLTTHTVYVIVCEIRNDTEIDREAARWLENVKSFAPNCPVILALNKADQNIHATVNERSLQAINPELRHILKTSAKWPRGRGVSALIEAIQQEVPQCINDFKTNADMLGIKQELECMEKDYISEEEYRRICVKHHIEELSLQQSMLNWFKDLGVAYFYSSNQLNTRLENVRVLNPAWLTNGIYRLILRTPIGGFLSHQTIRETLQAIDENDIMPDKVYTPQETEFILYVMRNFEISHNMENGEEMIPMKMGKSPPDEIDSFPKEGALHLRWEGSYLPNNLIHRLMIRKNTELDTKCVWRTGAQFCRGNSRALVEMDETALDVFVVAQHDSRQYMEEFRALIQRILNEMNITSQEVICCKIDGEEGQIPYEDVLQQYYDGRDKIYISGIKKYISPLKLLKETYLAPDKEAEQYLQIEQINVIHAQRVERLVNGTSNELNFRDTHDMEMLANIIRNTNTVKPQTVQEIKEALAAISKNNDLSFWQRRKLKAIIKEMEDKPSNDVWEKIRGYLGDAANLVAIVPVIQQNVPYLLDILKKFWHLP